MDRDIPSILTTLAGVASLTDLLTEMPLPTPLPQVLSNKSLLFHPRVAEEALKLLGVRDDKLVPQLVHSLSQTSAEHIELKDHYSNSELIGQQQELLPELLRAITEKNPNVFSGVSCSTQQTHWNHAGHTSPVGTRHTPQGSPASPASARLPSQPPVARVSVITEQQKPTHPPNTHCNSDVTYLNSDSKSNNGIPTDSNAVSNNVNNQLDNTNSENQFPNVNNAKNVCTEPANNSNVNANIQEQHVTTTNARVPFSGPSPAQASDAPAPVPVPFITEAPVSEAPPPTIKAETNMLTNQPVVRLNRLSVEDQALMQKSLSKFAENKPDLANELGIIPTPKNEEEESEEEDSKPKGRTRKKANNISAEDDDYVPDTFTQLVGNRKRKTAAKEEKIPEIIPIAKPKLRRVEKKFVPVLEKLSVEELMETNTYHRFNKSVETILENMNESMVADLAAKDDDEENVIQEEALLSRCQLQDLCTEAAKLKGLSATEMIPIDRLVRLLTILEINVRAADKVSLIADPEENENIREMWMETAVDRVLGAADAALTCLYIMTSPNMPKRVYVEDVIDRIIMYLKFQLLNTIFPSLDSVYRIEPKAKTKESRKRKANSHTTDRSVQILYNKVHELVGLVSELLNIQIMTDTTVLHASSMGVAPFFAENVSELQLSSLKLVTTIFTRYEKHRRLLLDDILASIARLPSSKRSLRTYRLNSEEHIQMLTALVLQLIQCVVQLPENMASEDKDKANTNNQQDNKNQNVAKIMDKDMFICSRYDIATKTAGTFLTVFLNKCGSKTEEIDYRPLFENFVQDLLTTVNKPEWPAAELLLSLLGTMLVKNFSNKGTDMSLRVASLDYLGVVAARLRKDTALSRCKANTIDQMIKDIKSEQIKEGDLETPTKNKKDKNKHNNNEDSEEERTKFLQRVLLDYLAVNSHKDEAHKYARHFYLAQWYKDAINEKTRVASGGNKQNKKHSKENHRSRRSKKNESEEEDEISDLDEENDKINANQVDENNTEVYRMIDDRKKFFLSKIRPFQEAISSAKSIQVFQTYIDYESAELISQYLASKRSFSQSFDGYLKTILLVLRETSIAIRTKAMKCLTMIVEADPSVLGIGDMQIGVNHSFLDHSTSVREAAVDLVGKFVLSRPELIDKYYDMLSARILDTGVSVRKRVIKILKDICIECPEFPKIPEICVKMIRRVNDEEGIRKLVMEVFQNMWFTPTPERPVLDKQALLRKVMNITDVVASSKDIGLEWFEQLLISLFKPKEDKDDSTKVHVEPPKSLLTACRQIVDCLIENVLHLEESGMELGEQGGCSQRLAACLTTLYLFAKIRPQLLVKHASTLQPYLSLKCQTKNDIKIISNVAQTLELVVPLMEHPSETFLAQLEEDSIKLIIQHDRTVISSCLSCLGSIVNNVTRNFKLIIDCFNKYYGNLLKYKDLLDNDPLNHLLIKYRPLFRRALFTVGLLLRHFDFTQKEVIGELAPDIKDQVYQTLMFFLRQDDEDIQTNTLKSIGFICIRHYEFMLQAELKVFYHKMLCEVDAPLKMKIEVLLNIESYLMEEENRMIKLDKEWAKRSKEENLKEMGDISSGMASTVIQLYLKEVLTSFLHPDVQVRHSALKVIQLILQQGLVHPVQIVPYLICMSTDCEKVISHTADKQLSEIEKKYPGFIHTKSTLGVRLSYQLQTILQERQIVRGSRIKEQGEYPAALNGYLYSLLRGSRQQRRALVLNMLKQFDEQVCTSLSYMLYLSDNLAYFPYQVQDEPLYIVHHIDMMISVTGTNLLQSFREGLIGYEPQSQPNQNQFPIQNQQQLEQEQQLQQQQLQFQQQKMMMNDVTYPNLQYPQMQQQQIQPHQIQTDQMQGQQMQPQQTQSTIISALDEDDEDEDALVARLPENTQDLQSCITKAQGCLLLLILKQHLKDIYGLSDGKISQYSPSEAVKVYEKTASRRNNSQFNPKATITRLKQGAPPDILDEAGRKDLITQYLDFKQLMLKLDPDDPEDEENAQNAIKNLVAGNPSGGNPQNIANPAPPGATGSVPNETQGTDPTVHSNFKVTTVESTPQKVPKLIISNRRTDDHKRSTPRSHKSSDKSKKHRHKKKRKKFVSSSGDESENDFSDPDFMA